MYLYSLGQKLNTEISGWKKKMVYQIQYLVCQMMCILDIHRGKYPNITISLSSVYSTM